MNYSKCVNMYLKRNLVYSTATSQDTVLKHAYLQTLLVRLSWIC